MGRNEELKVLDYGIICFGGGGGGGEGKLKCQLFLLMSFLKTLLPVGLLWVDPIFWFLQKASNVFVYGFIGQYFDFSL